MGDVQRYYFWATGGMYALAPDELPGRGFIAETDHERVVAEMEQAHAAALAEGCLTAQASSIDTPAHASYRAAGYAAGLATAAPRTLTADEVSCPWCNALPGEPCRLRDGTRAYKTHSDRVKLARKSTALIHDSGKESR